MKTESAGANLDIDQKYKPEGDNITVKEYANKMGLTVNGLCEVTGLSRMGLNNILAKGQQANNDYRRRMAVGKLLKSINEDADRKVKSVEQEHSERVKLLDMFYNK